MAKIVPVMVGGLLGPKSVTINHRTTLRIKTGVKAQIPPGYKLCLALRSSLGDQGLVMCNSPAQIDSDYRGEIEIILCNVGRNLVTIADGDRIAQCWLEEVIKARWKPVAELEPTERGDGGFGSTGVK